MASSMNVSNSSEDEKPSPDPPSSPNIPPVSESTEDPNLAPLENFQPAFKPSRGFILAFLSICIITLAAALDATSLSIALPIITKALHGTAIEAFWSGTSFLVTSAVFQPVIAGLSHVFGRKQASSVPLPRLSRSQLTCDQLVLLSSLFFAVGSIVAAVASNFTMMYTLHILRNNRI